MQGVRIELTFQPFPAVWTDVKKIHQYLFTPVALTGSLISPSHSSIEFSLNIFSLFSGLSRPDINNFIYVVVRVSSRKFKKRYSNGWVEK